MSTGSFAPRNGIPDSTRDAGVPHHFEISAIGGQPTPLA